MSKPTLSDLPPRYQAQALAQLSAVPKPRTLPAPAVHSSPAKNRIRQSSAGLNRTEAAFLVYLKSCFTADGDAVSAQALTLRLGNGVRFTPDFIVTRSAFIKDGEVAASLVIAFEVKGFMRDDAAVKLKVAASLYPWMKFRLATKAKGGARAGWNITEVLA